MPPPPTAIFVSPDETGTAMNFCGTPGKFFRAQLNLFIQQLNLFAAFRGGADAEKLHFCSKKIPERAEKIHWLLKKIHLLDKQIHFWSKKIPVILKNIPLLAKKIHFWSKKLHLRS